MAWDRLDNGSSQTFGPVLVPALNVTKNSWLPQYPDRAEGPKALLIAAMPFVFFASTIIAPTTPKVFPCYPDRVVTTSTQPAWPSVFAPVRQPLPPFSIAIDDDFSRGARTHPAQAPFIAAPILPPPVPALSWAAEYPDTVGAPPRALLTGLTVGSPLPFVAFRPSWTPIAPDWLPPAWPTAAYAKSSWLQELPRPPIAPLSASAIYPDALTERRSHAGVLVVQPVTVPPSAVVTPLSWAPTYPDRAGLPPTATLTGLVAASLRPIVPSVDGWIGARPDRVFTRWPDAIYSKSVWIQELPRPPLTPLSARVLAPDWISRREIVPSSAVFAPVTTPAVVTVTPLTWLARYPDQLRAPATAIPTSIFGGAIVPIVPTSGRAYAPVRIDGGRLVQTDLVVEPLTGALVSLSWEPLLPDRPIDRPTIVGARAFAVAPIAPPVAPVLSWLGHYPATARGSFLSPAHLPYAVSTIGQIVHTFATPATIIRVEFEDRTILADADDRIVLVEFEARSPIVDEDHTIAVEFEDRVIEVPKE